MSSSLMNAAEHVLLGAAAEGRDRTALVCGEECLTYGELSLRVAQFAAGLRGAGLRRGQRIAMLMFDTPDLVALHLATMAAGGIAVALPVRATAPELKRMLAIVRPFAVIVDAELAALAAECLAAQERSDPILLRRDREMAEWKASPGTEIAASAHKPSDPAFWVMTSGTTGHPKAVEHRHDNVLACTNYFDNALGATAADRFFATSRLHFSYALGTVFGALRTGATVVLHERWPSAKAVAETIGRHRPTILLSVPTLYHKLLEEGLSQNPAFRELRRYVSAGERLSPKIAVAWEQATGQPILDAMGCSESVYKIFTNTPSRRRHGSSGSPAPGVEVRLIGEDGVPIVDAGRAGALEVRMSSLCSGYRTADTDPDDPADRPADRFRPNGWFATGDLYARDEDGLFHHRGRSDDMLKVSGIWVSPSEIEDPLAGLASVAEAAAVAVQSPTGLTEIVLYLVPAPGCDADTVVADAREQLCRALPGWKLPRRFAAVTELPRTATGKMQRHKLRRMELAAP